jgi:hypothetical protein
MCFATAAAVAGTAGGAITAGGDLEGGLPQPGRIGRPCLQNAPKQYATSVPSYQRPWRVVPYGLGGKRPKPSRAASWKTPLALLEKYLFDAPSAASCARAAKVIEARAEPAPQAIAPPEIGRRPPMVTDRRFRRA